MSKKFGNKRRKPGQRSPEKKRSLEELVGAGPRSPLGSEANKPQASETLAIIGTNANRGQTDQSADTRFSDPMMPTDEEVIQTRGMLHSLFGEFGRAARTFVLAKHAAEGIMDMPEDIQRFAEGENTEWPEEETRTLGWPPVEEALRKVASMVIEMNQAEQQVRHSPGKLLSTDQIDALAGSHRTDIRQRKVVPLIVSLFKQYGLYDSSSNEEQLAAQAMTVAENLEKMADKLVNQGHGALLRVAEKQARGMALEPEEQQAAADNPELMRETMRLIEHAGRGVAAPCNQVLREMKEILLEWGDYKSRCFHAPEMGWPHRLQASALKKEAMQRHHECLAGFRAVLTPLGEICDIMHRALERESGMVTLTPADLENIVNAGRSVPAIAGLITYDEGRIEDALNQTFRAAAADKNDAERYVRDSREVAVWVESMRLECQGLTEHVEALRSHPVGENTYDAAGDDYRNVYFALRNMHHRLEMMTLAAHDLYARMAEITGKNDKGWSIPADEAQEDPRAASTPPSPQLKELARRIQHYCVKLHEAGEGKQAELQNHLDKLGAPIDRFDIALDMFERLHDGARKMVESMERRERAWHETGAAEGIAGR